MSAPAYCPALYERLEVAGLAEEGFFGSECLAVVGEQAGAAGAGAAAGAAAADDDPQQQQQPRVVYDEVR
jgi:hypothetical protein